MQSTKKLISVLILVLLCTGLAGCDFLDSLNRLKTMNNADEAVSDVISTMSKDSTYAMSQTTKDAQTKVADATNKVGEATAELQKAEEARNRYGLVSIAWDEWIGSFGFGTKGKERKLSTATAEQAKATTEYETAKATDEVYQASVNAETGESETAELKKYLPVVIIVIVILVALFILPKLFQKKPVPVPAPDPAPAQPPADVERSGQLKVNYERQLRNNCAKLGLDYDQTLADYGGDARKATESTMLMMR